jgi:hypothetical protein
MLTIDRIGLAPLAQRCREAASATRIYEADFHFVLCEYAVRMPWVAWRPPTLRALRLRAVETLSIMHTQEKNRERELKASLGLLSSVISGDALASPFSQ